MPFLLDHLPLLLIGAIMAAYWYRVLRMARKQRKQTGRAAMTTRPVLSGIRD